MPGRPAKTLMFVEMRGSSMSPEISTFSSAQWKRRVPANGRSRRSPCQSARPIRDHAVVTQARKLDGRAGAMFVGVAALGDAKVRQAGASRPWRVELGKPSARP